LSLRRSRSSLAAISKLIALFGVVVFYQFVGALTQLRDPLNCKTEWVAVCIVWVAGTDYKSNILLGHGAPPA